MGVIIVIALLLVVIAILRRKDRRPVTGLLLPVPSLSLAGLVLAFGVMLVTG